MEFNERAINWDTERRVKRARIVAEEIAKNLPIDRSYSAMEFGCGTGLISFNLQHRFENITLIDSSTGMLEVLNKKIKDFNIQNMKTKCTCIESENSIEERFNVIYNSMVLHHIEDTEGIIKTFYGLLEHDGNLYIVDLDEEDGSFHKNEPDFHGHNGFNQEQLKSIFTKVGFQQVEAYTFFWDEKEIENQAIKYSLFLIRGRKTKL